MEKDATDQHVQKIMKTTMRWVSFLSILGFASCTLAFVGLITSFATLHAMEPQLRMVILLAVVIISGFFAVFLPLLFLFRYATSINKFLKNANKNGLEIALDHQKIFWKYYGILTIVSLCIYGGSLIFPKFINLNALFSKEASQINTAIERSCSNILDSTADAVRAGIALERANNLVQNGPPGRYPASLDSAHDGMASNSNPFFSEVLTAGVTNPDWSKRGNTYILNCNGSSLTLEYNSKDGSFLEVKK